MIVSSGQALGPGALLSPAEPPTASGTLLTYFQNNQFPNKCKTKTGLFGIIDQEFVLPLPGISWNWT